MAAYYKVEVTLNSQAVQVGLPSPQSVRVTLPLVGPQGPVGPPGEQGPPGEVSGSLAWDNVTDKPTTFPPEAHASSHHSGGSDALDVVRLQSVLGNDNLGEDINYLDGVLSGLGTAATADAGDFAAAVHGHVAADVSDFNTAAAAAAPVSSVAGRTGAITLAVADVSGAVSDTDARLTDTRDPNAHAASHLPEGDDELFDQSLNTDDDVAFEKVTIGGEAEIDAQRISWSGNLILNLEEKLFYDGGGSEQSNILWGAGGENDVNFYKPISFIGETTAETTRANLGLGDSAVADIGTAAGEVAAGDHTHELDALAATGIAAGKVLAADGDDGAEWVDAPSGGSGEVRSDFVSPYTYTGLAAAGTSESTASWTIRRSEFDAGGSFVATLTASAVEWDDRLTASYT